MLGFIKGALFLLLRPLLSRTSGLQPEVLDRSGHRRASTASADTQRAPPDLNRERWIAAPPDLNHQRWITVGTAGPQPQALDRSGHRRAPLSGQARPVLDRSRTSTASA